MKIVIAQTTVANIDIEAHAFGHQLGLTSEGSTFTLLRLSDEYVNHSVKLEGDDFVVEINDEVFFKYMSSYLRVAKFVGPFVKPALALFSAIREDIADITEFMSARK